MPDAAARQTFRAITLARMRAVAGSPASRELVLFGLIGGSATILYTASNVLLTSVAGLRPSVAIVVTLAWLIPPTYLAQRRYTFRSDRGHAAAFPRYAGTQLIGNGVALIGAELFPGAIRTHALPAFVLIAGIVAVTNYGCLKFWAFRHPGRSDASGGAETP